MKQYQGDCLIVPVQGQAVITTHEAPQLRLPGEHLPRRWAWQPLVAIVFSFTLWLSPTPTSAAVTGDAILQATNTERTSAGLTALHHDPRLDQAATAKANDMFGQHYFAHQSPSGQRGWFWMENSGYAYTEAGENLAMDFIDGQDIVTAWMGSAGHRQNILSEKFLDAGVATVAGTFDGKRTTMVVMLFGRQSAVSSSMSESSRPVTTPAPERLERKTQPAMTNAQPTVPITTTQTVPSLDDATPRLVPQLNFTLQDPDPRFLLPAEPQVLGASDSLAIGAPTYPAIGSTLSLMILSSLALLSATLGLAIAWQQQSFPQPMALLVPIGQ